jgi:hypothetical protein
MHLTCRSGRAEDLAPCFRDFGDGLAYEPDLRCRVPEVWSAWLREGVLTAKVFETHGARGEQQAVGFGAWVFVNDVFAVELARPAQPCVRAQMVRRWLNGEPVLASREQARAAHAREGVTVLHLEHPLCNPALSTEERHCLEAAWGMALYETRAYRQAAMYAEVHGRRPQQILAGCGLRLVSDWADYWRRHDGPPADDVRPFLMGLTRAEALAQSGSHASQLFTQPTPRFGFTARQQELLREALQGGTDDALASSLHVSTSAVKKRWTTVYDQIATVAPEWLQDNGTCRTHAGHVDGSAVPDSSTRGSEKRRVLLNYLRDHPEELHFVNARRDV